MVNLIVFKVNDFNFLQSQFEFEISILLGFKFSCRVILTSNLKF